MQTSGAIRTGHSKKRKRKKENEKGEKRKKVVAAHLLITRSDDAKNDHGAPAAQHSLQTWTEQISRVDRQPETMHKDWSARGRSRV
jgi:hypothetical protein